MLDEYDSDIELEVMSKEQIGGEFLALRCEKLEKKVQDGLARNAMEPSPLGSSELNG